MKWFVRANEPSPNQGGFQESNPKPILKPTAHLNFGEKLGHELDFGAWIDEDAPLFEQSRDDRKRRLVIDDAFAQKLVHRFPLVGEKRPVVH